MSENRDCTESPDWPPKPFTPATAPTRRPGRSTPRSTPAAPSPRTASAVCAADSNTPAPATRPGRRWRPRWPPSRRAVRAGVQFRDGRHRLCPAGDAASRGPHGDPRRRLRRHLPADRQGLHAVGRPSHAGGAVRPGRGARRDHAEDPADLGGNADQSAAVDRRYRRHRPDRRGEISQKCWWTTPLPRPRCSSR